LPFAQQLPLLVAYRQQDVVSTTLPFANIQQLPLQLLPTGNRMNVGKWQLLMAKGNVASGNC